MLLFTFLGWEENRLFYDLERIWRDGEIVEREELNCTKYYNRTVRRKSFCCSVLLFYGEKVSSSFLEELTFFNA